MWQYSFFRLMERRSQELTRKWEKNQKALPCMCMSLCGIHIRKWWGKTLPKKQQLALRLNHEIKSCTSCAVPRKFHWATGWTLFFTILNYSCTRRRTANRMRLSVDEIILVALAAEQKWKNITICLPLFSWCGKSISVECVCPVLYVPRTNGV